MKLMTFRGKSPVIGRNNMIADNVLIIGDVVIGDDCSIWPGVVIRSDTTPIRIGNNVHIEENSILHTSTHVEDNVMIGHGCTIEAFIGRDSMIGNTASLMPMSRIGARCAVAAGSVLTDGKVIGDDCFIVGSPAKVHSRIDPVDRAHIGRRASTYIDGPRGIAALAKEYLAEGIWVAEPTVARGAGR